MVYKEQSKKLTEELRKLHEESDAATCIVKVLKDEVGKYFIDINKLFSIFHSIQILSLENQIHELKVLHSCEIGNQVKRKKREL